MTFSLIQHDYGDPKDVLSYDKKDYHKLGNHMVRVKLISAPINPADINMIEGTYLVKPKLPTSLGNEAVGEVIEVGDDVSTVSVGDRVFHPFQSGSNWIGFWQTSWVISEEDCMKVPDFISSDQAAMLTINPITAYLMVLNFVSLKKGDWIIQNCAHSAVGKWVIFFANLLGIKTINIVRSELQKEDLISLGATEVYEENELFSSPIKQKGLVKLALNGVGGPSAKELAKTLADNGVMVTYGAMARQPITLGNGLFIFKTLTLTGFNRTKWVTEQSRYVITQAYKDMFLLMKNNVCHIPIYKKVAISNFKDAFDCYFHDDKIGKVLLVNQ